jgi:hypothetical protein
MENDLPNKPDKTEKRIKEEIGTIKRIYSRLYFMRGDIEAIEKIKVKSAPIKDLVLEISDRINILKEMLSGELNEQSRIDKNGSQASAD